MTIPEGIALEFDDEEPEVAHEDASGEEHHTHEGVGPTGILLGGIG